MELKDRVQGSSIAQLHEVKRFLRDQYLKSFKNDWIYKHAQWSVKSIMIKAGGKALNNELCRGIWQTVELRSPFSETANRRTDLHQCRPEAY